MYNYQFYPNSTSDDESIHSFHIHTEPANYANESHVQTPNPSNPPSVSPSRTSSFYDYQNEMNISQSSEFLRENRPESNLNITEIKRPPDDKFKNDDKYVENIPVAKLNQLAYYLQKFPGTVYHLYERLSGEQYLSLLSLKDWDYNPPNKYIGSYRLNEDETWSPITMKNFKNYRTPLPRPYQFDYDDEDDFERFERNFNRNDMF